MENKVAKKPIVQLDIESLMPSSQDIVMIDIADFLFNGMIIKEKDFREKIDLLDTNIYSQKYICMFNSSKAIIPMWAYLLLATRVSDEAIALFYDKEELNSRIMTHIVENMDIEPFRSQRLVVKGCGKLNLTVQPYLILMKRLKPIVKAMSFGESCSMIPIYKN